MDGTLSETQFEVLKGKTKGTYYYPKYRLLLSNGMWYTKDRSMVKDQITSCMAKKMDVNLPAKGMTTI